ncbi:MAG: tryptophan synthase subunit alpha [Candidatus Caldatribacteriaceae bacterium]
MKIIPYILLGFPTECQSLHIVNSLLENSFCPFVEIGLPAQRPYMDGTLIRFAHKGLRDRGFTMESTLSLLEEIPWRKRAQKVILMGYLRDIESFGIEIFSKKIQSLGIRGIILVGPRKKVLSLKTIIRTPLVPLVSVKDSVKTIRTFLESNPPFIYFRVSMGKTGEGTLLDPVFLVTHLQNIRKEYAEIPIFAGFGIQNLDQAKLLERIGFSGVVVGSALFKAITENHTVENFFQSWVNNNGSSDL